MLQPPTLIQNAEPDSLPAASESILRRMFRNYEQVVLARRFGGGFSGSIILEAIPYRSSGIPELPAVVKLGPAPLIRQEARAYREHIRGRLAAVPEVWGDPVLSSDEAWAGLRYAMVGSGLFDIESLSDYASRASLVDLMYVLHGRLFVHLSSLWSEGESLGHNSLRAYYDRLLPVNFVLRPKPTAAFDTIQSVQAESAQHHVVQAGAMLELHGFRIEELETDQGKVTLDRATSGASDLGGYRLRLHPVANLRGLAPGDPFPTSRGVVTSTREIVLRRSFADSISRLHAIASEAGLGAQLEDPIDAIPILLDAKMPIRRSTVHGDLNLANVLVDAESRTLRIVDFAGSGVSHGLLDILRLETSFITRAFPEWLGQDGRAEVRLLRLLRHIELGGTDLPTSVGEQKALCVLAAIRQAAASQLARSDDWREYHAGLSLCLLATGKYSNLGPPSKGLAYCAAAMARSQYERKVQYDLTALAATVAAGRADEMEPSRESPPGNLPQPPTQFVGRAEDQRRVRELIASSLLVTLHGPGGVGKTRLAIETGRKLRDRFRDGVWLIDLGSARSATGLDRAVSDAIRLPEAAGADLRQAMRNHLATRKTLLILDNCEQVLDETATLVADLLDHCAGLRVLATSRQAIRLPAERIWPVHPFHSPQVGGELDLRRLSRNSAVTLFVNRAQIVQPSFELRSSNAEAIVEICRRLDGLPLAIELAAARVRIMSPRQIADRLSDRFRLLRQGLRSRTEHHDSLEATISWSYDLLSSSEQFLLDRLAVFEGGFTLESAHQVCAAHSMAISDVASDPLELLDLLTSLVDKSLVSQVDERAAIPRFNLLESIRVYGKRQLERRDQLSMIRSCHAAHFLRLAESLASKRPALDEDRLYQELDEEQENLRAAFTWYIETADAESSLRLCAALGDYWLVRGSFVEGRKWAEQALAVSRAGEGLRLRDDVVSIAGNLAFEAGAFEAAKSHYLTALRTADTAADPHAQATARRNLGKALDELGEYDQARALHMESLQMMRSIGERWGEAAARNNLGLVELHEGNIDEALRQLTACLAIFRDLEVDWAIGIGLTNIAAAEIYQGQIDRACGHLEEALAITRRLGDRPGTAYALCMLGLTACKAGQPDLARRRLIESRPLILEIEDAATALEWLEFAADLAVIENRAENAVLLLGAVSALREQLGKPVYPRDRKQRRERIEALRAEVGISRFEELWEHGGTPPWTQMLSMDL